MWSIPIYLSIYSNQIIVGKMWKEVFVFLSNRSINTIFHRKFCFHAPHIRGVGKFEKSNSREKHIFYVIVFPYEKEKKFHRWNYRLPSLYPVNNTTWYFFLLYISFPGMRTFCVRENCVNKKNMRPSTSHWSILSFDLINKTHISIGKLEFCQRSFFNSYVIVYGVCGFEIYII